MRLLRRLSVALVLPCLVGSFVAPVLWAQEASRIPRVVAHTVGQQPPASSLPLVLTRELSPGTRAPLEGPVRWLKLNGEPIAPGSSAAPGGIRLQAVGTGSYILSLREGPHPIIAVRAAAYSSSGGPARRASPSRSIPAELVFGSASESEEELLRLVVAGSSQTLPTMASVVSLNAAGTYADSLRSVPLVSVACPSSLGPLGADVACGGSPPLRVVADLAERGHPSISGRALLGEVGGHLLFKLEGAEVLRLPILGPAQLEPEGPGRYRVRVRATVVRSFPGGPPAVGENDDEARAIVREEVASASRMWGQCGINLGPPSDVEVQVVDPPHISMITVGCGRGLPASGGTIRFSVGKREIHLRTHEGESPARVATRLAAAVRKAGFQVKLLANVRAGDAALSSYDLLLTTRNGDPVELLVPTAGLSDDPSLSACEGRLALADGLEHFTDLDAATGTPEERYLLRALSDDDPRTIELLVVPLFGGMGRIGESFIHTRGGSLESAVILDRTGVRAGARSFTLAHELGHILLDLPGHPDDFGVDTPSSLMDADAADSTIFGPRRLSLEDCRRALRQSGRTAPVPLIVDWPLADGAEVAR